MRNISLNKKFERLREVEVNFAIKVQIVPALHFMDSVNNGTRKKIGGKNTTRYHVGPQNQCTYWKGML